MRRELTSNWKAGVFFTALGTLVLLIIALFELTIFGPQRLENERQARRDSPPKLVPPSSRQGAADQALQNDKLTAFRIEEWATVTVDRSDPAKVKAGAEQKTEQEKAIIEQERKRETSNAIKRMLEDHRRENEASKPTIE